MNDIYPFIKTIAPIGFIRYVEFLSFELMTIMINLLKDYPAMAAHIVFMQMPILNYMVVMGIGLTLSSYISSMAGARRIQAVRNLML